MTLEELGAKIAQDNNLQYTDIYVDDETASFIRIDISVPYDKLSFDASDDNACEAFFTSLDNKLSDEYFEIEDAYGIDGTGASIDDSLIYKFVSSDVDYDDRKNNMTINLYFQEA